MIVAILLGVIVTLVIALVWAICDKYDWKHVAKYDDWYEEKFKEIFQRMDSYLDKSIDHAELSRKSLEEYMDGIRDSLREELSKIHLDPSNLIALSDGSVVVKEKSKKDYNDFTTLKEKDFTTLKEGDEVIVEITADDKTYVYLSQVTYNMHGYGGNFCVKDKTPLFYDYLPVWFFSNNIPGKIALTSYNGRVYFPDDTTAPEVTD